MVRSKPGGKIKRIVLIEPRSSSYHVYSMVHLPRLGLPTLGAILEEAGYNVTLMHEDSAPIDFDTLIHADLVGISTITSTAPRSYALAQAVRSTLGIPIIIGGPHVTFMPEEALRYGDVVVRGEAEPIIMDLVQALECGVGFDKIPGIGYRDNGSIRLNEGIPVVHSLEPIPDPNFDLYTKPPFQSVAPIMTSRGCPYDCEFCSVTAMFGRGFRTWSVNRVMTQLQRMQEQGYHRIFFYDDIFNANPKRLTDLMNRMIEANLGMKWSAQVRVEIARDPALLELAAASGAEFFYIGFESVNPETLSQFNKKQTLDDIIKAVNNIHKYGIRIHGMFVIGGDADDETTADRTVDFAMEHKIDTIQLMNLVPIPGSRLFQSILRSQRILTRDWSRYDGHSVVFQPLRMTVEQLQNSVIQAMKRFYSIPSIFFPLVHINYRTAMYRAMGHHLVKEWLKNNRHWMDQIQEFSRKAGQIRQDFQDWVENLAKEWEFKLKKIIESRGALAPEMGSSGQDN